MSHISRKLNSIAWQWPYFLYIYILTLSTAVQRQHHHFVVLFVFIIISHNIFLLLLHESALQTSSFNCVKVYIIFASSDVRLPSGSRFGVFFLSANFLQLQPLDPQTVVKIRRAGITRTLYIESCAHTPHTPAKVLVSQSDPCGLECDTHTSELQYNGSETHTKAANLAATHTHTHRHI